jgi:hypothetical protein
MVRWSCRLSSRHVHVHSRCDGAHPARALRSRRSQYIKPGACAVQTAALANQACLPGETGTPSPLHKIEKTYDFEPNSQWARSPMCALTHRPALATAASGRPRRPSPRLPERHSRGNAGGWGRSHCGPFCHKVPASVLRRRAIVRSVAAPIKEPRSRRPSALAHTSTVADDRWAPAHNGTNVWQAAHSKQCSKQAAPRPQSQKPTNVN